MTVNRSQGRGGTATVPAMAEIDLSDLDNFARGFPHDLFELNRRVAPLWWHGPTRLP
jgi:hypothetical protein